MISLLETTSSSVQDTKTGLPLKSPAPHVTPQKTKKSDVVDVTTHIEETPLVQQPTKTQKTPTKTMSPPTSSVSAPQHYPTKSSTLRCEKLENEESCLRATLEGNVLAPFLSIDTQVASWQELYGLCKDKSHEEISRGRNRGYVSLSSTWDELLRDNSSRSKSRRVVNRALAALPWSRPILCNACGGSLVSTKQQKSSFMYASTKHLRPVHVPYSLRRRVWCALLDVGSNFVLRDEDIVSTSAMRERYASSLRRAEQIGIDCEEQVLKDVRRCHQYLRLAQTEMMRDAVTRLVKAWIVQGKFGTRGYYQGLSSVCVVFLVLFDMEEASAFSCLCVFLERHVLRPCSVPARAPVSSSRSPSRSPTKRMMRTPEKRRDGERSRDGETGPYTPPRRDLDKEQTSKNNWWDAQDHTLKFRLSKIAKLVGFHDSVREKCVLGNSTKTLINTHEHKIQNTGPCISSGTHSTSSRHVRFTISSLDVCSHITHSFVACT
mgnify:CR=1 FL=1